MNDVIIQFARLWGQTEVWRVSVKDEDISDELKGYDSEEMLALLTKWAEEFMAGDEEDTVVFFERKVAELIEQRQE